MSTVSLSSVGWAAAATVACACIAPAASADIPCANRDEAAIPANAYHVASADALRLPALLQQYHRIRLEPGADYRHSPVVTLRSNEALYGAAGTRVSRIIVAPGTHDAVVSGVVPEALEFPPSPQATARNCFERFAARTYAQEPLTLKGAVVENNLFLDVGQVVVDTSVSGRVIGNRFVRTLVHGASPAVVLHGRGLQSADRNTFLWMNVLGPIGDGVIIDGQSRVNVIGLDAENWNQHNLASQPAMMTVVNTRRLDGFMLQGGAQLPSPTRYLDAAANEVNLSGVRLYRAATPSIKVGKAVASFTNLLPVNVTIEDAAEGRGRLTAYGSDGADVRAYGDPMPADGGADRSEPWEAPHFGAIDGPKGDWRQRRVSAPDSRQYIQSLIDTQGIAQLPAGAYYVSGPLQLRNGQGIVGAGAQRTVIIARSAEVDLIVGADHYEQKHATGFALIDVTLQGGRYGIRHDELGAGKGAQFNLIYLSHVVIRDMARAGISISGIYGWDNNLIDNVTFYRMPVGVQQTPSPWYVSSAINGDVAGMNYMDKNVFYRCRFEQLGIGMELTAKRANGLNACIGCRFAGNTIAAIRATYNVSTVLANSDFVANGGDPVIASNMPIGIVASRFVDGAGVSFLDSDTICEGCTFRHSGAGVTVIGRKDSRQLLIDSQSNAVPLGSVDTALLLDSQLRETRNLKARVVEIRAGVPRTLVPGTARASEQLLLQWQDR